GSGGNRGTIAERKLLASRAGGKSGSVGGAKREIQAAALGRSSGEDRERVRTAQSAEPTDLRRRGLHRIRGGAGCVAGCVCVGHSAPAEGYRAWGKAPGSGLPAWIGGGAGRYDQW